MRFSRGRFVDAFKVTDSQSMHVFEFDYCSMALNVTNADALKVRKVLRVDLVMIYQHEKCKLSFFIQAKCIKVAEQVITCMTLEYSSSRLMHHHHHHYTH